MSDESNLVSPLMIKKWHAPVVEELSITGGTQIAGDGDSNGNGGGDYDTVGS